MFCPPKTGSALLLIALICAALLCAACVSEENDDSTSIDELIALGKSYLAHGDGEAAADAFIAARKIDAENTDATFGLMLANLMQFTNLLDKALELFSQIDMGSSDGDGEIYNGSDGVGDIIQAFFNDTISRQIAQNEIFYHKLSRGDEFDFQLENYRLAILDLPFVDFGGEFDKADLHFLGAVNALFDGVIQILLAHDLNFDAANLALPEPTNYSLAEQIGPYVDLLEELLNSEDYPHFLYLFENGIGRMQQAGVDFGNIFRRLYRCFKQAALETDDQADDQVSYLDANANGAYNEQTDEIYIRNLVTFSPKETAAFKAFFEKMAVVFYDGSALDENPDEDDPMTPATFNELLTAYGFLPLRVTDAFYIENMPPWPGIELGYFFAYPESDGLRSLVFSMIDLWNFAELTIL